MFLNVWKWVRVNRVCYHSEIVCAHSLHCENGICQDNLLPGIGLPALSPSTLPKSPLVSQHPEIHDLDHYCAKRFTS